MDLSSPHGSSINDFIPKDGYTLHYASFNEALTLVTRYGQKALMAKLDIKHASTFALFAWRTVSFLASTGRANSTSVFASPFGLRSSPYLFNRLAEAFEWLLKNSCHIQVLMHYLNDYFTVGPAAHLFVPTTSRPSSMWPLRWTYTLPPTNLTDPPHTWCFWVSWSTPTVRKLLCLMINSMS